MVFKPGQSGNPNGRPRLPQALRDIQKISPAYVKGIIAKLSRMSRDEMGEWLQTPINLGGPNNMEMMVASIIHKAIVDGDHTKLNFLLDRTIGKVVEEKKVQIEAVTYKTTVRDDGALLQEVVAEALGDQPKEAE